VPDPMLALKQSLFPEQSNVCLQCGTTDSRILKKCKGCRTAYYCSLSCMRQHWRLHRAACRALAQRQQQNQESVSEAKVNICKRFVDNEECVD